MLQLCPAHRYGMVRPETNIRREKSPMPWRSNGFKRLAAIFQQRCSRCLHGQVFATLFRVHEQCPLCRLPFECEPGYFTGAMYLSYGVAIIVTAPVWLMMACLGRSLGEVL